ncbi:MAG: iron-containing alcohol dehydrogenase [bacterium]|nr:iron-containing alcohol dehydrogenase [bacterium]
MQNFRYSIPTEVLFGKNQIDRLPNEIKKHGNKVLLVYGEKSIKQNGLYDTVTSLLAKNSITFFDLPSIQPNPRITSVREGIKICITHEIDFVLAVGAGSSIDCAKAIAAGFYYKGDPWDFFTGKARISNALAIGTVLTLAATGSEMNGNTVITNKESSQKLSASHFCLKPRFSILDPTYTMTVPPDHTAAGVADIMSHAFEQYFSPSTETFIQDRLAESVLLTCKKYGPTAVKEPENYTARANLMWAGSIALNGLLSHGKTGDWTTHAIEHAVSSYYDLTHGMGLAVITPHWMEYVLDSNNVNKFCEYAKNIWDLETGSNNILTAKQAIKQTQEFFSRLNLPSKLNELNIDPEQLEKIAENLTKEKPVGKLKKLYKEDIIKILKNSYK